MNDLSNKVKDFIEKCPDNSIESFYGVNFIKHPFMENEDPTFLDRAISKLFSNLYEDGYLTKKPTVFAGFLNDKISIELFLDK